MKQLRVLYRPLAAQLLWHHKGGRSELEYGLGSINAKLQLLASFGPDASPENRGKDFSDGDVHDYAKHLWCSKGKTVFSFGANFFYWNLTNLKY